MVVSTDTFDHDVTARSHALSVVVDSRAAWCGRCRVRGREWRNAPAGLELAKVVFDAEPQLAARCGVRSIPTAAIFRDGAPVTGFVGAAPARRSAASSTSTCRLRPGKAV